MPFAGSAHPPILQQKGPAKQKVQRPETPLGASMARRTCMEGSLVYLDKSANIKSMQRVNHSIVMANYTVLEILGQGCSGKTYKVLFQRDGRLYAMKKKRSATSEDIKEGILITSLKCPVCIPCYLCWIEDNSTYFVTDLAHCSLDSILDYYHFLIEEVIWIMMADISMALEYIHSNGIAHCDLKPENILVTNRIDGYNIPPKNCGDSYALDTSMDRLTPINDPNLKKSYMAQRAAALARSKSDKARDTYINKSQHKPFSVTSSSHSQQATVANTVPTTGMASIISTPMHTSLASNAINQKLSEDATYPIALENVTTPMDQLSLHTTLSRAQTIHSDLKNGTLLAHRQSFPRIISPCYERADDGKYFVRHTKGGFLLDKINLIKRSYSDSTLVVLKHTETMLSNNYPREYIFCEYEDQFHNEVQDNSHLIIQHFELDSPMRTRYSTPMHRFSSTLNQTMDCQIMDTDADQGMRIPHLGMSEPVINFHFVNISERISDTEWTRSFEKPQSTLENSVDSVIFSSKQDLEVLRVEEESSGGIKINYVPNELMRHSSVLAISAKSLEKADDDIEDLEELVTITQPSKQVRVDHSSTGNVNDTCTDAILQNTSTNTSATSPNSKTITLLATYKHKPTHRSAIFNSSEDSSITNPEHATKLISLQKEKSILCAAFRKLPRNSSYRLALLAMINRKPLYSLYFSTRFLHKKKSTHLACCFHCKKNTYHIAKPSFLLCRDINSVPIKPKTLMEEILSLNHYEHNAQIPMFAMSNPQDQESIDKDSCSIKSAITIGLAKNFLLDSCSSSCPYIDEKSIKNINHDSSKSSILSSHLEGDISPNTEADTFTKRLSSIPHQSLCAILPIPTTTGQYSHQPNLAIQYDFDRRHHSGENPKMDTFRKRVHTMYNSSRHALETTTSPPSRSCSQGLTTWNVSRPTTDLSLSLLLDPTSTCDSAITEYAKYRVSNFKLNSRYNELTESLNKANLQGPKRQNAFLGSLPDDMQLFNLSHSAHFQNGSFSGDIQPPFFEDYSYPNSRYVFSPSQAYRTPFTRSTGSQKKHDPCIYASSSKVHRLCRPKDMYAVLDVHPFQQMGFLDSDISCLLPPYGYQLYRANNLLSTSMCGDTYGNHSPMNFLSLVPSNSHTPVNAALVVADTEHSDHKLSSSNEGSVQHTPLLTPRQFPVLSVPLDRDANCSNCSQPSIKSTSFQDSMKCDGQAKQSTRPIFSPVSSDTSMSRSSVINTCNSQSILQNLVFTLSDFGHAQEAPFKESNTGDSRYICPQFLRTGIPDYSADVYSFGMTILEVMTNVNIPPNGESFECLRSHKNAVLDMLDANVFGRNLSAQLHEDDTPGSDLHRSLSFIAPRITYSKDLWLAMLDLLEPDTSLRPSIRAWRKKWKNQLDRIDRTKLYQKIESDQRAVGLIMNDRSAPSAIDKMKDTNSKDVLFPQYPAFTNGDSSHNPFQSTVSSCKSNTEFIDTLNSTYQSKLYYSKDNQMHSHPTNNCATSDIKVAPAKWLDSCFCQDPSKPTNAVFSINRTTDMLSTRPLNYGDLHCSAYLDTQLNSSDLYHDVCNSVPAPAACTSTCSCDTPCNAYTKSRSRSHRIDFQSRAELLGPDIGDDYLDFGLSYRQESMTPTTIVIGKQPTNTQGTLQQDHHHVVGATSTGPTKSVYKSNRSDGAETPVSLEKCGYLSLNWQSSLNEDSFELDHSQLKSPTSALQKAHHSALTCAGLDVGALDSFSIRAESDMILLDNRMREVPSEIQVGEPFPISFRSHESSDSALLSTELQLKALVDDESCENLDVEPKDSDHLIRSAVNTTLNSKVHTGAQSVALFASPRKAAEQTSATCTPESQIDSIQNDMLAIGRHISVGQAHSNASFTSNTTDRGKTNNPVQSIVNTLLNSPVSGVEQSDQSDLSIRSTKSSKSCNSTLHQSVVHPRSFFKTSLSDQKCHLAYQRQKEYAITQSVTSSCESTLSNVHSMPHISPLYSSLRSVVLSANPIDVAETSPESQSVSFCADGISLLRANKHRGRAISQMTRRELQIIGMNSVIDDSTMSLHERPGYCPICKLLRVPSDLRLTQHAMALCPSSSQTEEFIHYCVCAQASAFPDAGEFTHSYSEPVCVNCSNRSIDKLFLSCYVQKDNCSTNSPTSSPHPCTVRSRTFFGPGPLVSQKNVGKNEDRTVSVDDCECLPGQFVLSHVSVSHPPSIVGPWMLPFSKTRSLVLTYTERLIVSAISYLSLRSGIYTSMQVPSEAAASCFAKYEQTPTVIGCKTNQVFLSKVDTVCESSKKHCLEAGSGVREIGDSSTNSVESSGMERVRLTCKQRRRPVGSVGNFKAVGWADDLDGTEERTQKPRYSTLSHSKSGMLTRLSYAELQRLGYITPLPKQRKTPIRWKKPNRVFLFSKEVSTYSSGEPCISMCSLAFTAYGVFNCLLFLDIGLIDFFHTARMFRWISVVITIVLAGVLASILKELNMHLVFEDKSPRYVCIPHTRIYVSPRQIVAVCLRFLLPTVCFTVTGVGLSLHPQSRLLMLLLALLECMFIAKIGKFSIQNVS